MVKTEAQTRSEIIDKLLEESGWNVKDPMQVMFQYSEAARLRSPVLLYMKHERLEKGSKSIPLTMINTPRIALMNADHHLVEFKDQFPDAGKLIVWGRNK